MTFQAYEASTSKGQPIGLYQFTRQTYSWYFTSADRDMTFGSQVWTALPIQDKGFVQSGDKQDDAFEMTIPQTSAIAGLFSATPPAGRLLLRYFEIHADDPDQQMIMQWAGTVQTMDYSKPGQCTIKAISMMAKMTGDGIRNAWGRECSYALYDQYTCLVDKTSYATTVVIESLINNGLTGEGFLTYPSGRFGNGYIEWTDPTTGVPETRGLTYHSGNLVNVFGYTNGLSVAMTITAYPGCNHGTDCAGFYNNLVNYGGLSQMSGRSVFDGDPVF